MIRYDEKEIGVDEVFIGNTDKSKQRKGVRWKSLRFGKNAYDIYGNILPENFVPCFIKKAEEIEFERLIQSIGQIRAVENYNKL